MSWLPILEKLAEFIAIPILKLLFKNVSPDVWNAVQAFLDYINGHPNPTAAGNEFIQACRGTGCPLDLVKE